MHVHSIRLTHEVIESDWEETKKPGYGFGMQSMMNVRVAQYIKSGLNTEGGVYEDCCLC